MVAKKYSRLILLSLVVLMLSLATVSAAEYVVTTSPGYQNIQMGDTAEYEITIKNNFDTTENFEIYSPDVQWDVTTDPSTDKLLTIEGKQTKTARLLLKPLYVNPGLYGVALNVKLSGKGMLIGNYVMVGVNDPNPPPGEYLPALRATAVMDDIVDPRENITITLEIENQNRRLIPEMDIRIRSAVINTDYKTGIGPLEKKKVVLNVPIDALTNPQDDILHVTIFTTAAEKTYQHQATPFGFKIMHYGGLVENINVQEEFLRTTKIITLTNVGNGDFIDVYKMPKNFFENLFSTYSPESVKIKEDGVKYTGWSLSLEPFGTETIIIVTSYRIPFGVLLAAIIIFILYYLMRSPIVIHKSSTVLATKEGGISELKVLIVVKNRSPKPVKGVTIIDKVPHIADVLKDFEMGTLHPTKILKHDKKGTLIKWEVKEFERFEERVLAYKIKTRLSVLGEFRLPVVVVKFEKNNGKIRSTHSNAVTLVSA